MITNSTSTWPSGDRIWDVCRAIALAEGANVSGSAPDRLNNPGDLSKGDEAAMGVSGYVTLPDGEIAIHFSTKEDGWQALYSKIMNIASGRSSVYSPQWSWRQIAQKYAGDSSAWAANVARVLGTSPDARFADYFSADTSAPVAQGVEIAPGVTVLSPQEVAATFPDQNAVAAAGGQIAQVPVWVLIAGVGLALLVFTQD